MQKWTHATFWRDVSHSLNSLKGVIWGTIWRSILGVIKRDTRSLDYSSYAHVWEAFFSRLLILPLKWFSVGCRVWGLRLGDVVGRQLP